MENETKSSANPRHRIVVGHRVQHLGTGRVEAGG